MVLGIDTLWCSYNTVAYACVKKKSQKSWIKKENTL